MQVSSVFVHRATVGLLLAILTLALSGSLARAQDPPLGVEVRVVAQVLEGGAVEVGLEHRFGQDWTLVSPQRRILAADTPAGAWRVSSAVGVPIRQTQVRITTENRGAWTDTRSAGEFVAQINQVRQRSRCGWLRLQLSDDRISLQTNLDDCTGLTAIGAAEIANPMSEGRQELRVAARRLADGGIEVGLQRRAEAGWDDLQHPQDAIAPSDLTVGVWYATARLSLPPPPASVEADLRRGASFERVGDELRVSIDGATYRTNCGELQLRSFRTTLLLDTRDEQCDRTVALATVCASAHVGRDCDVQRTQVYRWETRQERSARFGHIPLTETEAQDVVDAIFADYFGSGRRAPRVVASGGDSSHFDGARNRIVLSERGFAFDTVVHEMSHALLSAARIRSPGHDGSHTALIMELWGRYVPLIDVAEARADARASDLDVAERPRPAPRADAGIVGVRDILCAETVMSDALCRAFDGQMSELGAEATTELYVGSGSRGEGLWWGTDEDRETGRIRTYVVHEAAVSGADDARARLQLRCGTDDELVARVWWRGLPAIGGEVRYQVGTLPAVDARWATNSGTWGDERWDFQQAPDARAFLEEVSWRAGLGGEFRFSYTQYGRTYAAAFDLVALLNTPAQPNLIRCGAMGDAASDGELVSSSGRAGPHFWWGVLREEESGRSRTYVVREAAVEGADAARARLQLKCTSGAQLRVEVWWRGVPALSEVVSYQLGDLPLAEAHWRMDTGIWDNLTWGYHRAPDGRAIMLAMSWAASGGGDFRFSFESGGDVYGTTFDLDGLFETPVQPNLVGCGG